MTETCPIDDEMIRPGNETGLHRSCPECSKWQNHTHCWDCCQDCHALYDGNKTECEAPE